MGPVLHPVPGDQPVPDDRDGRGRVLPARDGHVLAVLVVPAAVVTSAARCRGGALEDLRLPSQPHVLVVRAHLLGDEAASS